MYCSFASIGHVDIMFSTVSSHCLKSLHLLLVSVCNISVALILFVMNDHVLLQFDF